MSGLVLHDDLSAQAATTPAEPPEGARYYAGFWPGAWYALKGEQRDSVPTFVVRAGPSALSFTEEWHLGDRATRAGSFALRAWDQATGRGSFLWASDQGHAQVWEVVQAGSHWYIQRAFDQGGRPFLSRQTWIPNGDASRLEWVSERSFDDGRTWETRYRLPFVRGPVPPSSR